MIPSNLCVEYAKRSAMQHSENDADNGDGVDDGNISGSANFDHSRNNQVQSDDDDVDDDGDDDDADNDKFIIIVVIIITI